MGLEVGKPGSRKKEGTLYHKSCFEMFIDICHVGHDLLPVRPLYGDHLCEGEACRHPDSLGSFKGDCEVPALFTWFESIVRYLVWHIRVKQGAESHPVIPRA